MNESVQNYQVMPNLAPEDGPRGMNYKVILGDGIEVVVPAHCKFELSPASLAAWPSSSEEKRCALMAAYVDRGTIYFIQRPDSGNVKIGFTRSATPAGRLKSLQTASDGRLKLLCALKAPRVLERVIHAHMSGHHLLGEWFAWGEDLRLVVAAIKKASELRLIIEVGHVVCALLRPRRDGAGCDGDVAALFRMEDLAL